jgi:hypothetical protein
MVTAKKTAVVTFLSLAIAGLAVAAPIPVKATNTWKGSLDDTNLREKAPANGVITNARDWEQLVKVWKVADKVPEVNFDKELIVLSTTVGSRLDLRAILDDKGDLKAVGFGTSDIRPGFRFVNISLPKEGIKTVNGKPLPK